MDETTNAKPKKSGTFMKVVLTIITLLAIAAAAAMGLLYYNALTNLELVREKNVALGQDRDLYKAQAAEYELEISEYEQEIADLTKRLAESQALLETPNLPAGASDDDGDPVNGDAQGSNATLNSATTLDVKPSKLFDSERSYTVIGSTVNVRSGPSTNYRQVHSVSKDDVLTAYGEDNGWLCVKAPNGTYGWVSNNLVRKN